MYSPADGASVCSTCASGSWGVDYSSFGEGATSCQLCVGEVTAGCLGCPANMQLNNNLADLYATWCIANTGYYAGAFHLPFPAYMTAPTTTLGGVTYTASASSSLAGNEPYKAFAEQPSSSLANNGWTVGSATYKTTNPNNGYYMGESFSFLGLSYYPGEWIEIQLSQPIMLGRVVIVANILNPLRAPKAMAMLGSNDGSIWDTLYLDGFMPTFTAGSTYSQLSMGGDYQVKYSYYRLAVSRIGTSQGVLSFDKLRLYEYGVFQCRAGTYATGLGLTSAGQCIACAVGMYSTGVGMTLASTCQACGIGTYMDTLGGSVCTACPANSNTSTSGATQRGSCVCSPSYAGNLTNPASTCTACPVNYYCAGLLQNTCPAHTHSPALSSLQEQCRCVAGYRCTYTRNVTMRFNFALTQSSYLAQQASIQTQLASAASVPVSSVSSNYTVQAGLVIPPPPPPPAVM
jgi:hypothetical protein